MTPQTLGNFATIENVSKLLLPVRTMGFRRYPFEDSWSLLETIIGVTWNGQESFRVHTLQLGEKREWEMACGKDSRRPRDPDVNTGGTVLRTTPCQWGSKKHPRHSATFAEARREANEVEKLYEPQSSGFTVDELAQQSGAETKCSD